MLTGFIEIMLYEKPHLYVIFLSAFTVYLFHTVIDIHEAPIHTTILFNFRYSLFFG